MWFSGYLIGWCISYMLQCLFVPRIVLDLRLVKKHGRKRLQIDLGCEIMCYAIRNSRKDLDEPKPNWMRPIPLVPCACNKCFFCLHSLTTSINHKCQKSMTRFIHHDNTCTKNVDCTEIWVNLGHCSSFYRSVIKRGKWLILRRDLICQWVHLVVHLGMNKSAKNAEKMIMICSKRGRFNGIVAHWIFIIETSNWIYMQSNNI